MSGVDRGLLDKSEEPASERETDPTRRDYLFHLGVGVVSVTSVLLAIPIVGFVFSGFAEGSVNKWISLGPLDGFPQNITRLATFRNPFTRPWDGQAGNIPVWTRRLTGNEFQVFAINCAHLGCPVRWFQESGLFLCPCHGGVYYADGAVAAGPPPRGLFQYKHKIEKDELWIWGGQIPTLANPV
ncbi:MAG: ubiquinol-cytochrome c reductase iron-sulfur subunit [Bryobacteraceae bacterium]